MNTTTHEFLPEDVMAFVDGELSELRTAAFSIHVSGCDECRSQLTKFESTRQALHLWNFPASLKTLEVAVLSDLLKGKKSNRNRNALFFWGWNWKQFAGAFAISAAALFVVWNVSFRNAVKQMPSPVAMRQKEVALSQELEGRRTRVAANDKGVNEMSAGKREEFIRRREQAQLSNSMDIDGYVGAVAPPPPTPVQQPMIARTVAITIITNEFDATRKSLDAILFRHAGYFANVTISSEPGSAKSLQGSLRIPSPQLPAVLLELKGLGRVSDESQQGEEVTQEHADLIARLKNSRETEQRLQAILTQRTGKISDVLEVEQEIARVRGEIEQMEAEQKNLEHRVDFATIELKLSEEYKARINDPNPAIATRLRNSLVNGFRNAFESLLGIVLYLSEAVPTLLLWLLILFIPARILWRRYRRAQAVIA